MKKHYMVLFLHFEGVPESHFQTLIGVLEIQLVYLRMSRIPLLNFEEGPGSRVPGPSILSSHVQGPGPTFTPCLRQNEWDELSRSSLSQMFLKIGVLKKFTNFTGKQLH